MNEADLKAFATTFSDIERKVWESNFSGRDDMGHMMASMPLVKLYAKGIDALIKRPPSPPEEWFDGYAKEQQAKLLTREVFAVASLNDGGLAYTSMAGPNAAHGRLVCRLFIRDTPRGRRVVGTARTCPICMGAEATPVCGDCQGKRWKQVQGQSLPSAAVRQGFEIIAEPSAEDSRSLWSYVREGGL